MEHIIRQQDFTSSHTLEYFNAHMSMASFNQEVVFPLHNIEDNYMDEANIGNFILVISTILQLFNGNKATEYPARHVDTQERKSGWRVQIRIEEVPASLCAYLKQLPSEVRSGDTVYLGAKGESASLRIGENSITLTAWIDKL